MARELAARGIPVVLTDRNFELFDMPSNNSNIISSTGPQFIWVKLENVLKKITIFSGTKNDFHERRNTGEIPKRDAYFITPQTELEESLLLPSKSLQISNASDVIFETNIET